MDRGDWQAIVHGILQARILEWVAISFSNGDGGTLQKNITGMCGSAHRVWATLGLPPLTAHVLSRSTLLRLQNALQGNCLKWALGCMLFPGLSCSGSGSWVLHKGTDSVGHAFCAIPRSEELRRPGAWRAHYLRCVVHLITSPVSAAWFPGCAVCCVSPLGG